MPNFLIFRGRRQLAAVPLAAVAEVLRPLPVSALSDLPPWVLGLSLVRGRALPVLEAGQLIGEAAQIDYKHAPCASQKDQRFVVVHSGKRQAVLAVSGIEGLRRIDVSALQALPALAVSGNRAALNALGVLDGQLLTVLETIRLLSDELWRDIEHRSATVKGCANVSNTSNESSESSESNATNASNAADAGKILQLGEAA